jgi:DNA-directed RNA polymerase subunit RPC12/RpoP
MLPRPGATPHLSARLITRGAPRLSPIKPPDRCPHCNSKRLIKKGTRKKKLEDVRLYRCRACGRTFAPGPRAIRNKTYPLPEILEAFTLYDRGNTLESTAEKISSRYGHRVAPSSISRWLAEHPALTTYRRLRDRGRQLFTATQVIRTHKLYHRQVYEFAYHRAKLAFLKDGTLDDKRATGTSSTSPGINSADLPARFVFPRRWRSQFTTGIRFYFDREFGCGQKTERRNRHGSPHSARGW